MTDQNNKSELPNIIFYAPILEYPPAGGPQISVTNAIKALSLISNLYILTSVPESRLTDEARAFFESRSKELAFTPLSKNYSNNIIVDKFLNRAKRGFSHFFASTESNFISEYAKARGVSIFWIDRVLEHAFNVCKEVKRQNPSSVVVGDTCAVYSRFILRELPMVKNPIRRALITARGKKKEKEELELVNFADVVTAVSTLDADYFRSIANDPKRIKLFSNVIDLDDYKEKVSPVDDTKDPFVVLLGSYGHKNSPMDRAARWVIEDIMPIVRKKAPNTKLYIIGRNAEKTLSHVNEEGVIVVGRVPSVVPYLQHAAASLVPLKFESGTRFKILETGAASKACVSTTLGAEGLATVHDKNIFIGDTAQDFAEGIIKIVNEPEYGRQLGQNLYDLIMENYSLEAQRKDGQEIINFLGRGH